MPTKDELVDRVRELEAENVAMRELLDVILPKITNRVSTLTDIIKGKPSGGPLANREKAELARASMLKSYRAGRGHGFTKTKARQFANDIEMLFGNKQTGYSRSWLIKHLKD